MIKYLGSKRRLVPRIVALVERLLPAGGTVIDLFSGTSRVGHALKARGHRVVANDHNAYAATLARALVQADHEDWAGPAQAWLDRLARLPARPGYFTRTFCERSRFFHPDNGARIDAIRQAIAEADLHPELEAILLTSLLLAADRVDSTTGVQMAYLKSWARRAMRPLELRLPPLLPRARAGKGEAHELDALEAARRLRGDVAYLDPPYNQHSYLGNYHVWETLVRWDAPETYGKACKRVDVRERRSPFNSRRRIREALAAVIDAVDARHLVLSFSNEGHLAPVEVADLLARRGPVEAIAVRSPRYVGARIGIHDPRGVRVGKVSHLENTEYLFVVPAIRAGRSAG